MAQMSTNLQEMVDLRNATTNAQASAKACRGGGGGEAPAASPLSGRVRGVREGDVRQLADRARRLRGADEEGAEAADDRGEGGRSAKAKATRKARGTKGPVAIQEVTGNVIGVQVTPITAPVAPATPDTPATPPTAPANASSPAPAAALPVK